MKEIIIDEYLFSTIILVENGKILKIKVRDLNQDINVHDIYYGIIKNISSNGDSAFIDIGSKKNAYLQLTHDRLSYKVGDSILVEVLREENSKKGAKVTDQISIAKKEFVIELGEGISYSKNINTNDFKKKFPNVINVLEKYLDEILDNGNLDKKINHKSLKVLFRSSAMELDEDTLIKEIKNALDEFKDVLLLGKGIRTPGVIYSSEDDLDKMIKENYDDLYMIFTNSTKVESKVKSDYPGLSTSLSQLSPINEKNLRNKIDKLRNKKIVLKNGTSLYIEENEALTTIDVNSSGLKLKDKKLKKIVNFDCVEEIKKQIELRNIAGTIVIDFLEMENEKDKEELYFKVKEIFRDSETRCNVYPLTELSLMQIARKKEGKSLRETIFKLDTDKKSEVSTKYLYEILYLRLKEISLNLDDNSINKYNLIINSIYDSQELSLILEELVKEFSNITINIKYGYNVDLYKLEPVIFSNNK